MTNHTPPSFNHHHHHPPTTSAIEATLNHISRSRNPDSEIFTLVLQARLMYPVSTTQSSSSSNSCVLSISQPPTIYKSNVLVPYINYLLSTDCAPHSSIAGLCRIVPNTAFPSQRHERMSCWLLLLFFYLVQNRFCKSQDFRISFTIPFYILRYNPRGIKLGKLINI